jgi:hypothetical protein
MIFAIVRCEPTETGRIRFADSTWASSRPRSEAGEASSPKQMLHSEPISFLVVARQVIG